jgi:hypothetical protein
MKTAIRLLVVVSGLSAPQLCPPLFVVYRYGPM